LPVTSVADRINVETKMRVAIANEGLKAAPPVTVTVVAWMQGLTLTDAVALATLIYIVLQASYLVWRWIREARK
jgi:hypothetical protein